MYFSDLKYEYEQWINDSSYKIENKQRLNLSNHAYRVLQNDAILFRIKEVNNVLESGMINHVFRNYRLKAKASISYNAYKKEIEYENLLKEFLDKEAKKWVISLLVDDYKKSNLFNIKNYLDRKDYAFYFRVDSNNLAYLASEEGQSEAQYYNDNIAHYIKAVIEEYTELPYVERECIYHESIIEKIKIAVLEQKVIKIVLKTERVVSGVKKNNTIYFKPLGIFKDKELMYNYLVGHMNNQRKGEWRAGSIRLTSIKSCEILEQYAFISKEQKKKIEDTMKKKGVQYLSEEQNEQKILVKFTSKGEMMYHRMLNQRPLYIKKSDDGTYEFDCTLLQAENYFFKFGHNVKIIEPYELAEKFAYKYQLALKNYD